MAILAHWRRRWKAFGSLTPRCLGYGTRASRRALQTVRTDAPTCAAMSATGKPIAFRFSTSTKSSSDRHVGRPPFPPFLRDAWVLASDLDRPPTLPRSADVGLARMRPMYHCLGFGTTITPHGTTA